MSTIPFGVPGRVINGEHPGMMVLVENDSESSGGCIIYRWWDGSHGPNKHGAFDDWVESPEDLQQYIAENGWEIEWEE